ncbi:MAG: PQQ-dependent sugar dehydrogenase [Planctomycetales bacterium]|nr:PQQ-dependent sugar dehydrogenase [Planctomycetales bacterium]
MNAVDLCVFLTFYSFVVTFAAARMCVRRRSLGALLVLAFAAAATFISTVVGYYLDPERTYPALLRFMISEHDFSAAVAALLGIGAAGAWLVMVPAATCDASPEDSAFRQVGTTGILSTSIIGVVVGSLLFLWKDMRGEQRDPIVRIHVPEFVIEKAADLEFLPVRIAVSDQGRIFVSYTYFENWGDVGGTIVELTPNEHSAQYHTRVVADSPLLMRCYGLATRDNDLFVSRTGIAAHAQDGKITYDMAGAVTRLRDLDGDGYFEYADDVVPSIPGSRGPDTMHQNNGIVFAPDGSLFVTTASADDRALDAHDWSGAILRCSPDFTKVDVFARGFRNPFSLEIGPEGELFATDNDVDENPGDELNHVVQDAHYGHPFVIPNERSIIPAGFTEPILIGEAESNYLGMAYATAEALPEKYRNCLYVTDFMQNRIWRLRLERSGDTFKVTEMEPFATLSTPVDIAVGPDGDFFCISRRTENVYRIRLKQQGGAK